MNRVDQAANALRWWTEQKERRAVQFAKRAAVSIEIPASQVARADGVNCFAVQFFINIWQKMKKSGQLRRLMDIKTIETIETIETIVFISIFFKLTNLT